VQKRRWPAATTMAKIKAALGEVTFDLLIAVKKKAKEEEVSLLLKHVFRFPE